MGAFGMPEVVFGLTALEEADFAAAVEEEGLNNLSTASLVPAPIAAPVNALVTILVAELLLVLAGATVGFLAPEVAVVLVGVVTVLVTFGAVDVPAAGVFVTEAPVAGTVVEVVVDGLGETTDEDVVEVIGALTPAPVVGNEDS